MHKGMTSPSLTSLLDVAKYDCTAAMHNDSYFRLLDIGVGMRDREMHLAVGTAAPSLPKGEARTMMRCGGDGHILKSADGDNLAQLLA